MIILIINGPNLNLLGTREPNIYGTETMDERLEAMRAKFSTTDLLYYQSNSEGSIIDRLQTNDYDALIINPGAYTHYSYAIADALKSVMVPKLEVHISNLYQRESFRQKSVTAANTNGLISGFGLYGYELALQAILHQLQS